MSEKFIVRVLNQKIYLSKAKAWLFILSFHALQSCTNSSDDLYNPCVIPLKLETFWPANSSLDWIKELPDQILRFKSRTEDSLSFQLTEYKKVLDIDHSQFYIVCPQDSLQKRPVGYSTKSYLFKYNNLNKAHPVNAINIQLTVVLDERHSTYDGPLLADLLNFSISIENSGEIQLMQFPVLDRGFIPFNTIRYLYKDDLMLGQNSIKSVYYNDDNAHQFNIYYTDQGFGAIRFLQNIYWKTQ
ncbi:MAG: hypothetical protein IPM34_04935 [Saprospiraceae bacterium]|nr:hypothetical protein [Saprospiraceae bacterium]